MAELQSTEYRVLAKMKRLSALASVCFLRRGTFFLRPAGLPDEAGDAAIGGAASTRERGSRDDDAGGWAGLSVCGSSSRCPLAGLPSRRRRVRSAAAASAWLQRRSPSAKRPRNPRRPRSDDDSEYGARCCAEKSLSSRRTNGGAGKTQKRTHHSSTPVLCFLRKGMSKKLKL